MSKEVARRWRGLTDEQRAPYQAAADDHNIANAERHAAIAAAQIASGAHALVSPPTYAVAPAVAAAPLAAVGVGVPGAAPATPALAMATQAVAVPAITAQQVPQLAAVGRDIDLSDI